jgi:hypothetical protein
MMLGSTFICEQEPEQLKRIAGDFEAIKDFKYVEMNQLLTLNFETALQDGCVS